VTALIGRLKLSGDVGLLHKDDADRLIENIPSDLDIFSFNREFRPLLSRLLPKPVGGLIMTELYIRANIRFAKPKHVKLAGEARRVMQTADPSLDVEDHLRRLDAVLPCPGGAEKRAECLFDTRKWRLEDAKELLIKQFLSGTSGSPV